MLPDRALASLALVLAVAGACAPLPTNLPARPALEAPRLGSAAAVAPAADAQARGEVDARWWELFGDAQLTSLIDAAQARNPDLAAVAARLRGARAVQHQAELDSNAHLDANVTGQRERISEHGFLPRPFAGETLNLVDVSLGVTYSLDWWGRNRALVAAATSATQAVRAEQAAAQLAVAALVADAYFVLADAQVQAQLAQQQIGKRRAALAIEQSRQTHGLASPVPVREAEQVLARAEDAARRDGQALQVARYRLAAAIGYSPEQAEALPVARLSLPPALPATLPLDWLARRPDVAAQGWRVRFASDLSDALRADFYPNINLMLLAGLESRSASQLLTGGAVNGSFGAAIHVPIFNTNSLQNRLGIREADYAAAVGDYNRTVLDAARQVAEAYTAIAALAQREEFQQRALKAAEEAEALSRSRYRNGLAGQGESLAAQISALAQRQGETAIRTARLRATVALFQSLGGGWNPSQE